HNGTSILLVRRGDRLFALAETCSHFNGPLSEGKLVGDSIVCPWHTSRFALQDGRVLDGPAVHPQPCLQVLYRLDNLKSVSLSVMLQNQNRPPDGSSNLFRRRSLLH